MNRQKKKFIFFFCTGVNKQRPGKKFRLQTTGGAVIQRGTVPGDLRGSINSHTGQSQLKEF